MFRSSKLLSLDDESGKKLVKVLLFLITEGKISKEEKLIKRIKEDALSILFRHFNQREEFIHAFKQVMRKVDNLSFYLIRCYSCTNTLYVYLCLFLDPDVSF